MASYYGNNLPSTTEAAAAQAQSREGVAAEEALRVDLTPYEASNGLYTLGEGVSRAERVWPYEHKPGDPIYRPLKIFTQDPATSFLEGSIASINLPYEPLQPGPEGHLLKVEGSSLPLNLEDPRVLIRNGLTPSMSDAPFRSQMTYAVCSSVYAAFRSALGRYVAWGFSADPGFSHPLKLTIRTEAFQGQNAYYDKNDGSLQFGWYHGDKTKTIGNNLPGGKFYTCLSHDIIAHEVTHALLDGLRANFTFPSSPDVLAFHEAFADLVAIFQRFSYDGVLHAAIRQAGPNLNRSRLLTDIAVQFGQTTKGQSALRSAIEVPGSDRPLQSYNKDLEPHKLGSVLVSAVFDAFTTIFERKVRPYIRLATDGTGILPVGELPSDLVNVLARKASRLASQFLSILIRSIDYCPPVDLHFGDYLRAMITADRDLVPDDPFAYREAIVDAFRRRAIFPTFVDNLSEDALVWSPPRITVGEIAGLNFANLRFRGDPQNPAGAGELLRQARCLGNVICRPEFTGEFGLLSQGDARQMGIQADLPCIHSIRSSRRVGPDGQVVFDLIAEVTQRRIYQQEGRWISAYGGSTIILGPHGEVRYVISKSVSSQTRLNNQLNFISSSIGRPFWEDTRVGVLPRPEMFRLLHNHSLENMKEAQSRSG